MVDVAKPRSREVWEEEESGSSRRVSMVADMLLVIERREVNRRRREFVMKLLSSDFNSERTFAFAFGRAWAGEV